MCISWFVMMCALVCPQTRDAVSQPKERGQVVAHAVDQLGSPLFVDRNAAAAELRDMGRNILPDLQKAYSRCADFEVRTRLQEIAQAIIYHKAKAALGGFLGVRQQQVRKDDDAEPRWPEAHVAIRVVEIITGHAAEGAGLRVGDLIVEIDGNHIKSSREFVDKIRAHVPGDRLVLAVFRGSDRLQFRIPLGVRSMRHVAANLQMTQSQKSMLDEAAIEFRAWCAKAQELSPGSSSR